MWVGGNRRRRRNRIRHTAVLARISERNRGDGKSDDDIGTYRAAVAAPYGSKVGKGEACGLESG